MNCLFRNWWSSDSYWGKIYGAMLALAYNQCHHSFPPVWLVDQVFLHLNGEASIRLRAERSLIQCLSNLIWSLTSLELMLLELLAVVCFHPCYLHHNCSRFHFCHHLSHFYHHGTVSFKIIFMYSTSSW